MCCLFAFFYANKARISNFQSKASLGKMGGGGSSAPNDTPWHTPDQVILYTVRNVCTTKWILKPLCFKLI